MSEPAGFLATERLEGGIHRLVMTQPGKKNALNRAMREALATALAGFADDPAAQALILAGADGTYSAGGDIQGLMAVEPAEFRAYLQAGHRLVRGFWSLEKPAVAAIEGVGVGGGLALAMCCDHVVIGRSARVGFTFVRIGFVPDWGTPFTVTRRVGPAAAQRLFQSGELIGAEEALRIGLVDEIAEDGAVQAAALDAARRLAQRPARALALTKRMMRTLPDNLDAALEMELAAQQSCFKSDEFLAGVARFL